jgi:hypothetical protein
MKTAKQIQPGWLDIPYLETAWDLGKYQTDPDIQFIAKQQ